MNIYEEGKGVKRYVKAFGILHHYADGLKESKHILLGLQEGKL